MQAMRLPGSGTRVQMPEGVQPDTGVAEATLRVQDTGFAGYYLAVSLSGMNSRNTLSGTVNQNHRKKVVLRETFPDHRVPAASSSRAATRFSSDGCVEKSSIRVFPERAGMMKKAFAPSTSCFFSAGM